MSADMHYDLIIVGSGAGGGTFAHAVAPSGKRILVIERGGFIPRERENWDPREVFECKRYLARETWYDRHDQPFQPYTHYCVGGNTKVYGAALLRMRQFDFDQVRHVGSGIGDGISPAWPISYADLEPYYTRAERMYSVHGRRGLDPFDPPASAPYPFPPLDPEPRIRDLFDDLAALGVRPFPIPLGVRLDPDDPADAPCRLSHFDGYPDLTETKADSHVVALKPILSRRNVTLLTGARVERLVTDRTGGEVRQVVAIKDGQRLVFRADVVVLACGAINTAALLLRSACDRHPRGLANASDQVGRNYMAHQNGCLVAVTETDNPSQFQKHFGITDFYRGAPPSAADAASPFPLGTIQLMGKPDRATLQWLRGDALPGVAIEDIERRTIDFFLTAEDLPDPDNRVTLRPDGSIRVAYAPNNTAAYDRLQARLADLLVRAEARHGRRPPTILASRLGVSAVSHQNGTCRFGADPASSVLDPDCRAHDLDNLYVVDASFFPSSSAVNPSLTIMANALRVADRLLERLGAPASTGEPARLEARP
jgi:choline dehydrogenase-like flavoprotein